MQERCAFTKSFSLLAPNKAALRADETAMPMPYPPLTSASVSAPLYNEGARRKGGGLFEEVPAPARLPPTEFDRTRVGAGMPPVATVDDLLPLDKPTRKGTELSSFLGTNVVRRLTPGRSPALIFVI